MQESLPGKRLSRIDTDFSLAEKPKKKLLRIQTDNLPPSNPKSFNEANWDREQWDQQV
jgi:hypothetical protein